MMEPEIRRRLVSAHDFAARCAGNLEGTGSSLYAAAKQLEIAIKMELASNPVPGSKEVIGGATITHRPDLVHRQRVAEETGGVSGGLFPGEGGYPPLRKGSVDVSGGGLIAQEPNPPHAAEPAVPGLVTR